MGFISEVRKNRRTKKAIQNNDEVFQNYLTQPLEQDQLQGIVDMIEHAEVNRPLMNHVDKLVAQTNLTDKMKEQIANHFETLPASPERDYALDTLDDNKTMLQSLEVIDEQVPFRDKIKSKIKNTYDAINERVDYASKLMTDKTSALKSQIADKKDTTVDTLSSHKDALAHKFDETKTNVADKYSETKSAIRSRLFPAVDMIKDRAKNKLLEWKNEYRTRKLTYENDQNLKEVLKSGLSEETFNDGLNAMSITEVRFPMVNNADAIFKQEFMTPTLANEFFDSAQEYLDTLPNDDLRNKFNHAYDAYFDNVESQGVKSSTPEPIDKSLGVDVKYAHIESFDADGHPTWETLDGHKLTDDDITQQASSQYPTTFNPETTKISQPKEPVQNKTPKEPVKDNQPKETTSNDDLNELSLEGLIPPDMQM